MNFFIDPVLLTLPSLTESVPASEADTEAFLGVVEGLVGWASLLNEHKAYLSRDCRELLYDPNEYDFPPVYEVLQKYWTYYHVGSIYALQDVYEACQRLLDIDTLATIEDLIERLEDPYVDVKPDTVKAIPEALLSRHKPSMRAALKKALGFMTFISNWDDDTDSEFSEMGIATSCFELGEDLVFLDAEIYMLEGQNAQELLTPLRAQFPVYTSCEDVEEYVRIEQELLAKEERIISGERFLVVGGEDWLRAEINELRRYKRIKIKWIEAGDRAVVSDLRSNVGNYAGVVIVAEAVAHSVSSPIEQKARELRVPLEYVNKGIKLEEAIGRLCDTIRERKNPS